MGNPLSLERTLSDMVLSFADEAGTQSQFMGTLSSFEDPAVQVAGSPAGDYGGGDFLDGSGGFGGAAAQDPEV